MWHFYLTQTRQPLAWSIKHPNGTTYSRTTFAEAIELAEDLSAAMKSCGLEYYKCRVYKTYGWVA